MNELERTFEVVEEVFFRPLKVGCRERFRESVEVEGFHRRRRRRRRCRC